MNQPRRALEYLNKSLILLQSEGLLNDWRAKYQSDDHAESILARYSQLQLSHPELLDRQTAADLSGLETRTILNAAMIHSKLGETIPAAELSFKALAAAQRTTGRGISAFGEGEIFKIVRTVAQYNINARKRKRAVQIVESEITRAAGNRYFGQLESELTALLKLIKNGATDLKGSDNW